MKVNISTMFRIGNSEALLIVHAVANC